LKQLLFVFAVFLSFGLFAQTSTPVFYTESFRQGATQVVEEKFDVRLSSQDRTYHERIKDSGGSDRYDFTITPISPEGDTSITSWQAKLADLRHRIYDNILLASLDSEQAGDPKNQLARFNPSRFSTVPASAKRIIKVEGFYVVFEVKAFHFTPADSPYLDSMTVAVEFTNTDPRTNADTAK
jgi:hypothetical protein